MVNKFISHLAIACVALVATAGTASAAPKLSDETLAARATAAKTTAADTKSPIVTFKGGYYDATTNEVYIDQGARVARLQAGRLVDEIPVPEPTGANAPAGVAAASDCPGAGEYVHCETITCANTTFWLNYVNDNFSNAYFGTNTLHNGYAIHIRNSAGLGYRMILPRGVRAYRYDHWGFVSSNCVSGGVYGG